VGLRQSRHPGKVLQRKQWFSLFWIDGNRIQDSTAVKMDIMKKYLQKWKVLESIEWAESDINGLVKRCGGKMRFEDDLQQYVC
jgi:hypothetical protein